MIDSVASVRFQGKRYDAMKQRTKDQALVPFHVAFTRLKPELEKTVTASGQTGWELYLVVQELQDEGHKPRELAAKFLDLFSGSDANLTSDRAKVKAFLNSCSYIFNFSDRGILNRFPGQSPAPEELSLTQDSEETKNHRFQYTDLHRFLFQKCPDRFKANT